MLNRHGAARQHNIDPSRDNKQTAHTETSPQRRRRQRKWRSERRGWRGSSSLASAVRTGRETTAALNTAAARTTTAIRASPEHNHDTRASRHTRPRRMRSASSSRARTGAWTSARGNRSDTRKDEPIGRTGRDRRTESFPPAAMNPGRAGTQRRHEGNLFRERGDEPSPRVRTQPIVIRRNTGKASKHSPRKSRPWTKGNHENTSANMRTEVRGANGAMGYRTAPPPLPGRGGRRRERRDPGHAPGRGCANRTATAAR